MRDVAGMEDVVGGALPIMRRLENVLARIDDELLGDANVARVSTMLDGLSGTAKSLEGMLAEQDPAGVRQQILEPLHALLGQANTILESRGPDLARLLANLNEASGGLEPRLARLEADLRSLLAKLETEVGSLLSSTAGLVTDNRAELAETARRLRRTMWETEMAVRKIRANPALLLFGDAEPDLDERPVDYTQTDLSGRARPFRQRDETEVGGK